MKPWGVAALGAATAGIAGAAAKYLGGRKTINGHVAGYARYWDGQPSDQPGNAVRYVALGDSAAQGVGASCVTNGYVPRIGRRLAEFTGRPVAITNLSLSGASSGDVAQTQLEALARLEFEPDLVTLDVGANDVLFHPTRVEEFAEAMETIVQALPPGSFVSDVPWMVFPGFAASSATMAERAAELIEQHNHHLVRLHQESRSKGYRGYLSRTAADWFHPNDSGYAHWADMFWRAIENSRVLEEL